MVAKPTEQISPTPVDIYIKVEPALAHKMFFYEFPCGGSKYCKYLVLRPRDKIPALIGGGFFASGWGGWLCDLFNVRSKSGNFYFWVISYDLIQRESTRCCCIPTYPEVLTMAGIPELHG